MNLFIKGFIIGIGKIIPGVSGSLLAIRLNVYEKIIASINNLFNDFKVNAIFLIKISLGVLLAILLGSRVILFLLNNFYWPTMIAFVFLIMSGIPLVLKETKNYYIAFISFVIYFILLYMPSLNIFHSYYFMGFLESFTTIIPGISGTALFMSLGLYNKLLLFYTDIFLLDLSKIIPFSIGLIIGGLILIRFINYCFVNYRSKTYGVILGFLVASIISMLIKR